MLFRTERTYGSARIANICRVVFGTSIGDALRDAVKSVARYLQSGKINNESERDGVICWTPWENSPQASKKDNTVLTPRYAHLFFTDIITTPGSGGPHYFFRYNS